LDNLRGRDEIRSGLELADRLEGRSLSVRPRILQVSDIRTAVLRIARDLSGWLLQGEDGTVGLPAVVFTQRDGAGWIAPLPVDGWSGLVSIGLALAESVAMGGDHSLGAQAAQICRQALASPALRSDRVTLLVAAHLATALRHDELLAGVEKAKRAAAGGTCVSWLDAACRRALGLNFDLGGSLSDEEPVLYTTPTRPVWVPDAITIRQLARGDKPELVALGTTASAFARFETACALDDTASAEHALRESVGAYDAGLLGVYPGLAPRHAPCGLLGAAAVIRMAARFYYGGPDLLRFASV
jgi:hypothetical protein